MEENENSFDILGVPEDLRKQLEKSLNDYNKYTEMYTALDEFCHERFGNDVDFSSVGANTLRAIRALYANLEKAKTLATMPSDQEDIESIMKDLRPVVEFTGKLGGDLLDLATEAKFNDNRLDDLIGAALV